MPRVPCSLYPTSLTARSGTGTTGHHQQDLLLRVSSEPWTWLDNAVIASSSLFLVGSIAWVPALYVYIYKKWKRIPPDQKRKKAAYAALILALTAVFIAGPQRTPKFADKIQFRDWRIWQVWCRFIAVEVWRDTTQKPKYDNYKTDQNITAIVPHGIFPFAIGVAGVPGIVQQAFGKLRIMTATAINLFPFVRDVVRLVNNVDASRPAVNQALQEGSRIALIPGGIPEIFEGYPKPLTHPDDEYSIVPSGFLKMALQHQVPVIPVYCFGATKLLRRLQMPDIVERISLALRISICIFYGRLGLPIPFRQQLTYVMGDPIVPPSTPTIGSSNGSPQQQQQQEQDIVKDMHRQFCDELVRLFDNHKESYGWGHKSLHLISR